MKNHTPSIAPTIVHVRETEIKTCRIKSQRFCFNEEVNYIISLRSSKTSFALHLLPPLTFHPLNHVLRNVDEYLNFSDLSGFRTNNCIIFFKQSRQKLGSLKTEQKIKKEKVTTSLPKKVRIKTNQKLGVHMILHSQKKRSVIKNMGKTNLVEGHCNKLEDLGHKQQHGREIMNQLLHFEC